MSTNPWKITADFKVISNTREEYLRIIGNLKATCPPEAKRTTKTDQAHASLIETLEQRLETIDAELAVSFLSTYFAQLDSGS